MEIQFFNNNFKKILLAIAAVEIISLAGHFYPLVSAIAFFAILPLVFVLSLYKLEYGVWVVLAELFIGSKGYLLSWDYGGSEVSIRIALWVVLMSVWFAKVVNRSIKAKKIDTIILRSPFAKYFLLLSVFIIWGAIKGFLNNNAFNDIFFDLNGWFYLALIFPVFEIFYSRENFQKFFPIFTACVVWLAFKTFFLLFVFSHNFSESFVWEIYRWVRLTGVGEITRVQGGFFRVFLQSQIFAVIGFFIVLVPLIENFLTSPAPFYKSGKKFWALLSVAGFQLSVILVSFSRSFWLGTIAGIVLVFIYFAWQKTGFKKMLRAGLVFISVFAAGALFFLLIVKFPYPEPIGGFNTADIFSKRAGEISGEAAVSSRWSLLPVLWNQIKKSPVSGQGFGANVTYISNDPRVRESSPTGEYTTFAFEWGWLDIWLKLGVLGMLAYLVLLGAVLKAIVMLKENKIIISLGIGLATIIVINAFSPYFNHPLGIGYLIIVAAAVNKFFRDRLRNNLPF